MRCTRPILAYELSYEKIYNYLLEKANHEEIEITPQEFFNNQGQVIPSIQEHAFNIYNKRITNDLGNKVFEHQHILFKRPKEWNEFYDLTLIPCGTCNNCKLNKAAGWGIRCTMESKCWTNNCFITLTYDPEHLPKDRSVKLKDMQDFFKRLNSYLDYHTEFDIREYWENPQTHKYENPLRKLYCLEYGPKTHRPHGHAVLFNWDPLQITGDCKFYKLSKSGFPIYNSKILDKTWGKGWATVQPYTTETANYVARYCTKKLNKEVLVKAKKEPEQIQMSRNGGLGIGYWNANKEEIKKNGFVFLDYKEIGIPKYFKKKWQQENPYEFFKMKKHQNMLEEYYNWFEEKDTDLDFWAYLKLLDKNSYETLKKLPRNDF